MFVLLFQSRNESRKLGYNAGLSREEGGGKEGGVVSRARIVPSGCMRAHTRSIPGNPLRACKGGHFLIYFYHLGR